VKYTEVRSVANVSTYQLLLSGEELVDHGLFLIEEAVRDARRAGLDLDREAQEALARIRATLSTLLANLWPEPEPEDLWAPEEFYGSAKEVGQ